MTNISNRESISGARSAKNRWVPAWRLLGLLRALFASGCGRGERTELRLAINPWPGSEFLDLAKEKGFLAQEGLNVRLVGYLSLSDCRVALESGQAEAMACSLIEVLQARKARELYDLIGLDIMMPEKDGQHLLGELRKLESIA